MNQSLFLTSGTKKKVQIIHWKLPLEFVTFFGFYEYMIELSKIAKILVIKLRAIGDVLLSTPLLENLKKEYPHLKIDFLCEQFAADVLIGNPWLNDVVKFNRKTESGLALIRRVRSRRYDMVIDLFGNPRTALISRLSGARYRIGFPFRGRAYAYNHLVHPRGGEVHNVDFNLDVLKYCSVPIISKAPHFPLSDNDRKFSDDWIQSINLKGKKIIGINAGGGWYTKRWSLDKFASLADKIKQTTGYEILLFWGPGEDEQAKKIASLMHQQCFMIPSTTLKQMGALLNHCSYLVTNDSGPMHISASLGIPTLGLFGPTNPHLQGPVGEKSSWVRYEELDCLGCNLTKCPIGNICMSDLTVEMVHETLSKMIAR